VLAVRDALVDAVARGELPRERLRDAARRLIAAKFRYGLCRRIEAADGEADSQDQRESVDGTLARFRSETERYLQERGLR
jgi:beta-glucosidase-like glycosyl hydrolase